MAEQLRAGQWKMLKGAAHRTKPGELEPRAGAQVVRLRLCKLARLTSCPGEGLPLKSNAAVRPRNFLLRQHRQSLDSRASFRTGSGLTLEKKTPKK